MKTAKIAFIWSIIAVFVAVSNIGILGALGKLEMKGWEAALVLLGPCLGIVASALSAKHLFDDPDAICELRDSHHQEILRMKREHASIIDEDLISRKRVQAAFSEEISNLKKYISNLTSEHEAKIAKMKEDHAENIRRMIPRPAPTPKNRNEQD